MMAEKTKVKSPMNDMPYMRGGMFARIIRAEPMIRAAVMIEKAILLLI